LPDAAGEDCIVLDHGDGGLDGATATVTQYDATSGIHRSAGERRSRKRTPTVTRLRTSAEPILMEPLHQRPLRSRRRPSRLVHGCLTAARSRLAGASAMYLLLRSLWGESKAARR
jgi:hypothetical protein